MFSRSKAPWIALPLALIACASAVGAERTREIVAASGVKGGFCVHVGAKDGPLAAELAATKRFLVQVLAADDAAAKKARALIRGRKQYGRVTVDLAPAKVMPYADNLVNLLVIEEAALARGLSLKDCFRAVAPAGVLCLGGKIDPGGPTAAGFRAAGKAAGYALWRKPRPKEMDDWGQARHGPARTQTSNDMIAGPPRQMRWIDVPRRSRSHSAGPIAAVSAGGRLFTIVDCAPPFMRVQSTIRLIARDAFSGVELWRKSIPGKTWQTTPYSGTLVADGQRVFTVARGNGPAVCLDSTTGALIRSFEKTRPRQLLLVGKLLLMSEGATVRAFDTVSGAQKWTAKVGGRKNGMAVVGEKVFVHCSRSTAVTCLSLTSGARLWGKSDPAFKETGLVGCISGTLVLGASGRLTGVAAADGKILWQHQYSMSGRGSRYNVFFSGGFAWVHSKKKRGDPYGQGNWQGIEVKSGKVEKLVPGRFTDKCAPGAATQRFLITGRLDFFDWQSGKRFGSGGTRGACRFGSFPANGMIYTFPTDCHCFPHLKGIMGIGPAPAKPNSPPVPAGAAATVRLIRGPAWGQVRSSQSVLSKAEDWPVFRHDAERSGVAGTRVPPALKKLWSAEVGPRPSQATIAGGKVFVSAIDGHQVHALAAADGKKLWSFSTGARVDGPPTCYRGLVIFGCRDGRVYCLNAASGKLVWRFRAAPREQRVLAYGQPESSWPVPASLPVIDGKLFVVAGRHTALDGGMYIYSLEPSSGKLVWSSRPQYAWFADLPVKSGQRVFVGRLKFDSKTGDNPRTSSSRDKFFNAGKSSSFADPSYSVRTHWNTAKQASGQMLCFGAGRVLGFHGNVAKSKYSLTRPSAGNYKLFMNVGKSKSWKVTLPIRPGAILLTPEVAFAAGPPDTYPFKGGRLHCYSTTDGKELGKLDLGATPTFDGMSAADGRLYVATEDGKLHCFGTR
jgi:outer membrane protein assembly factor BamB